MKNFCYYCIIIMRNIELVSSFKRCYSSKIRQIYHELIECSPVYWNYYTFV